MDKALILAAFLALAACAERVVYTSDFCQLSTAARPNGPAWDAADGEFKAWLRNHNATGKRLCGWKP